MTGTDTAAEPTPGGRHRGDREEGLAQGNRPDAVLIDAARQGDTEAFAELYRRHAAGAHQLAGRYVWQRADRDDVVAGAFADIWAALQCGRGPTEAFRSYLLVCVRRRAARMTALGVPLPPEDDPAWAPLIEWSNPALSGFDRRAVTSALEGLPQRWQAVLWDVDVEGCSMSQVGRQLGITPQAASALVGRAREGLRTAYVAQHLKEDVPPPCGVSRWRIASYVRGVEPSLRAARLREHLATCPHCQQRVTALLDTPGLGGTIAGRLAMVTPLAYALQLYSGIWTGLTVGLGRLVALLAVTCLAIAPATWNTPSSSPLGMTVSPPVSAPHTLRPGRVRATEERPAAMTCGLRCGVGLPPTHHSRRRTG